MNRYFKISYATSATYWTWDGQTMWCGDDESDMRIGELETCANAVETDEFGRPLVPSAEDVASAKGDHQQQVEADLA